MKAFYCEGRDRGAGLSDKLCFTLVKRLLAHNERRSRGAEDSLRVLASISIHRLRAKDASGYCLVVNDNAVLDNATGPEWDNLLVQCGAVSRTSIPTAFQSEPFCTGNDLYRMVSPAPGDGGEVHHVMLEAREGRFDALIEEAMQVEDARAAVVTLDCGTRGWMTCVLVEFGKGGYPGGSIEALFPSAEIIRISDNSQRLVFTHLGTTCRWMFSPGNEVVLMPVLSRENSGQSKALVTFRGEDDTLEPVLCSWNREDESGLGSFVKLSVNTSAVPLMRKGVAELLADGPSAMPVMLTRDARQHQDDRRLYVISDSSPAFPKFLARVIDAAEFSGQGALSFARWQESSNGGIAYAFQSSAIRDFESYRDVRTYRIVQTQMGMRGLAVREGFRFLPEMPDDEGWISALSGALFDSVKAGESAWAVVDAAGVSDAGFSDVSAFVIPSFKPFEGYRKHIEVFGPVVRAVLVADEKAKHQLLSAQAESAWNQAAETEKLNSENGARKLFDELAEKAGKLDEALLAMRDDVRSTTEMAEPLHAEAKLARKDLQAMASGFTTAVRAAADRSANWAMLQKQFNEHARLLESAVRMLDDGVRVIATAELERITAQNVEVNLRLDALRKAEAQVIEAHGRSGQLVAALESETSKVTAEIDSREKAIMEDGAQVAEFDALVSRVRSLAALEHAKSLESMKIRHAEAQCSIREQEARDEINKIAVFAASLTERLRVIGVEAADIARRRESTKVAGAQVRVAEANRDNLRRTLEKEEMALADLIRGGDPRVAAQHLIDKAKSLRVEIDEVEEGKRLLTDGEAILSELESKLVAILEGISMVTLRADVAGSQKDIESLEKAIRSLEDVLAADAQLKGSHAPDGRLEAWTAFRREAEQRLKQARNAYLRSRNPVNPALVDEINASVEALRQLLPP